MRYAFEGALHLPSAVLFSLGLEKLEGTKRQRSSIARDSPPDTIHHIREREREREWVVVGIPLTAVRAATHHT